MWRTWRKCLSTVSPFLHSTISTLFRVVFHSFCFEFKQQLHDDCHCDTMNELKWNFQHFQLSPIETTTKSTVSEKCEEMSIVYRDHENFFFCFLHFNFSSTCFSRAPLSKLKHELFSPLFPALFHSRIFVFSSKFYSILNAKVGKGERECLGLNRFCYLF